MRSEVSPNFLARQVCALDKVLDGRVPLEPAVDCLGVPVLEGRFDGFSFFVAASYVSRRVSPPAGN